MALCFVVFCLFLRLVLLLLIVDCLCMLLFIDVCLLVCYEFVVVDLFVWCYVYLSAFRFFVWPTHCVFSHLVFFILGCQVCVVAVYCVCICGYRGGNNNNNISNNISNSDIIV
jgi:hypothetical protein